MIDILGEQEFFEIWRKAMFDKCSARSIHYFIFNFAHALVPGHCRQGGTKNNTYIALIVMFMMYWGKIMATA